MTATMRNTQSLSPERHFNQADSPPKTQYQIKSDVELSKR